jgi:phosphate-selective porin OprO/OprP
MVETAYQHRGFSWQQELHWKSIDDRVAGTTTRLIGGYAQAGMFFSEVFDGFPTSAWNSRCALPSSTRNRACQPPSRMKSPSPQTGSSTRHRNKLTLDYSLVARQTVDETDRSGRVRLQWDWQF